ncbi:uncharacterized protein LOC122260814 isoform X1 [Penaeus japonicus]|uniref:uncharacterized protein LOC122260814 isoform X1 n=1 Tax=Penaeus japonicus TaxID=27405 RepID=UPI001C70DA1C|nr:uncharacterized protein LOC122260814 isoform X1 [Penaeus japonicus]XP_042884158.1 uncharacterized protein LOC122260814 isoform X1 [Penaeus japonicus]
MSRTVCFMFTVLLTLTGLSLSAHVQPVQDSDLSTVPERLREFLLIRRLINNLHAAEAGQEIPAVVEDPTRIRLEHELQMLAKAHEADMDFGELRVSRRAIRSFCAGNSSRQCRSFCFNLGDRSCSDGDVGGNGEDSHFIESGMNPGK